MKKTQTEKFFKKPSLSPGKKDNKNVFQKFQPSCLPPELQELEEVHAALTLLKEEKWKIVSVTGQIRGHDTTGKFLAGRVTKTRINEISNLLDQACKYIEGSVQQEVKPGQEGKFYGILALIYNYPNFKKPLAKEVENALETLKKYVLKNTEKGYQVEDALGLKADFSYGGWGA